LNAGSSSLKYQLRESTSGEVLKSGRVDKPDESSVRHILEELKGNGSGIEAVGHRIVHGGDVFAKPVLFDYTVLEELRNLEELAPLHNEAGLKGYRSACEALGDEVPQVAVFDTIFHRTLPDYAAVYAIPQEYSRRWKIRRYGFHGLAHRSVVGRYARIAGVPRERVTVITAHLGSGCSITAVRNGCSADTSMGFTPLEGLIMAKRSGDLDPAIIAFLAQNAGFTAGKIIEFLNRRSGLLGLSGVSSDMRELLGATDADSLLAVECFCYRVRKYIGAYLAALGGASAVIFSGGIGENLAEIRLRISRGLEWFGLHLNDQANLEASGREGRISKNESRLQAFVIPADQEAEIVNDTAACLGETP
jgi:acetate kinase